MRRGIKFQVVRILAGFALAAMLATNLAAQGIYATLTGLVTDQSQAVVAGAKATLKNTESGSLRDTVSNSDGYFTFASVPVGSYELTVEAKGFTTYKVSGITLNGGDKRNVDAQLTLGATTQTVEITGGADVVAPVDSGEKSDIITNKELQNYVSVGSNAAEFIKIMPGFGIQNGTSNKSNYTGETIGINANGDAGSQSPLNNAFSYNGLPSNSLDITADGAHVSDPGCNCDTPVNPNSDMISELQVKMSNFSAENQKGPAVITSVAKSGGKDFHGSGFFYARNYAMNANDALFNASGQARPENKYYYPGGTIGGPVLIPGTHFNHDRNKLFFFSGFEYFYQVLDTGLLRATMPTAGELNGNFSPAEVAKEGNITASGGPPGQINAAALAQFPGGIIPANMIDKNMQNLMHLYPSPNADPNATGGYNYVQAETFNQNNMQWMSRVDYSISDNTKLFVRYNLQRETQLFPVGLWWRQTDQVPYPTPVEGKNKSDSVTASLTHVFSPTMTNEFVFGYTYIGFPNVFQDPSKVDRSNVGYGYQGLFKNGVAQIPSFGGLGWTSQEAGLIFNPGGFEAGGPSAGLYADKWMPSFSDTITKVWSTHTLKAGFFYEWIRNSQPANNSTNGQLQVWNGNSNTFGNEYADLLYGNLYGYTEIILQPDQRHFVQHVRRLRAGFVEGFQEVDPGTRAAHDPLPAVDRPHRRGLLHLRLLAVQVHLPAHGLLRLRVAQAGSQRADRRLPDAGALLPAARWRGVRSDGAGQDRSPRRMGPLLLPFRPVHQRSGCGGRGTELSACRTISTACRCWRATFRPINVAAQALSPAAVDSKDDKQPYTDSYSFTVSQRTPWSGLLEVAYVGNQSHDLATQQRRRFQYQPGSGGRHARPAKTEAWIRTV